VAVVESILDATIDHHAGRTIVQYAVEPESASASVARGEAQAVFQLPSPSLDRLMAVAEEGDLLPPKSTWFEPKAPAGLVINEILPPFA
jgi:uncharacterized protein (DUF1015 family)